MKDEISIDVFQNMIVVVLNFVIYHQDINLHTGIVTCLFGTNGMLKHGI
jgi:hypothetical protein